MPSAYAHHQFGAQLLPALSADIRIPVQRYRSLFDLGLQGPDFFFYYKLGKDTPVRQLAREYHHRTGAAVFSKICRDLGHPTEEELAYLYGLLAHYCLDSVCHPIVCRVTGEDGLAHNAMESEFERFLLARSGVKNPHSYHRGAAVRCSGDHGAVIARFYPEAKPQQIRQAVNTMGTVLGLLTVHAGAKRVLKLMGGPNPGLLMHRQADPAYAGYNEELLAGYRQALDLYPQLLQQLHSHMTLGEAFGEEFEAIFG